MKIRKYHPDAPAALIMAIIALALLLNGCGSAALRAHAVSARVVRAELDTGADAIGSAVPETAFREMAALGASREDAERRYDVCVTAEATHDAARLLWKEWIDQVLREAEGRGFDEGEAIRIAKRLGALFLEINDLLRELGKPSLTVPEFLESLVSE